MRFNGNSAQAKIDKRFKKGDRVYARTVDLQFGAYAEYTCLPEESVGDSLLSLIPSNITYDEAVAIPFGGMLSAEAFMQEVQ